ncbi:hypothetical protein MACJ_002839 [Theileria orientalis]|uniref:Uncharacterized protein n=1 Tax=Theileria orientalis TaxID=68886 RepID=A0A976M6S0_THEOR|nr:hypothetical protein MACJ_002839 [Theileria orientalis]
MSEQVGCQALFDELAEYLGVGSINMDMYEVGQSNCVINDLNGLTSNMGIMFMEEGTSTKYAKDDRVSFFALFVSFEVDEFMMLESITGVMAANTLSKMVKIVGLWDQMCESEGWSVSASSFSMSNMMEHCEFSMSKSISQVCNLCEYG